jgi:hypothetical protein
MPERRERSLFLRVSDRKIATVIQFASSPGSELDVEARCYARLDAQFETKQFRLCQVEIFLKDRFADAV